MPDSIKALTHVVPGDPGLSFAIKRMEDIYDEHGGQPDEPHRHEYYTCVLVSSANGEHIIDFESYPLKGGQVFFVGPGQVHQVIEKERSSGWAITFSPSFLVENGISLSFIQDLHLFQEAGAAPPLEPEDDMMNELNHLAEKMSEEFAHNRAWTYASVGAYLRLFLIQCQRSCTIPPDEHPQDRQAAVTLLKGFKQAVDEHFSEWHKVNQYADVLHVHPDYLNQAVKNLTGRTAKEHIQSRIILAAKRMLKFSALSAKEIAFELGFSEASHFSQFFKKCTGQSPSHWAKA